MATPQSEHEAQEAWEAAHPDRVDAIKARATRTVSEDELAALSTPDK